MPYPPEDDTRQPEGESALRSIAMPADTNPSGDIFGGWILSQMDLAGGIVSAERALGRTATVAIEAIRFHRPVMVGDEVSCYGSIARVGRTSITVKIECWVRRALAPRRMLVTEGCFTYVALDENRVPRLVDQG
jgi:acyl-CoA thioesterase YciA